MREVRNGSVNQSLKDRKVNDCVKTWSSVFQAEEQLSAEPVRWMGVVSVEGAGSREKQKVGKGTA